jgi:pimeloyl-ACP methyl ester carboxylesterase
MTERKMDDLTNGRADSIADADGVDFIEAGAGPLVVLVHSSMSGARQWSALIGDLEGRFLVRAINLFGYGRTPAWSKSQPPSLDDFAELVADAVPSAAGKVHLVGHSFGGTVAAWAAACRLRERVASLVLIEPSTFFLLDRSDRREAYREISALANYTIQCVRDGDLDAAAERFIDYWCGRGTWAATPPARRSPLARAITLLPHEWGAALTEPSQSASLIGALPRDTLVMCCVKTARPSSELVELLLQARPDWEFAAIAEGGHMAAVTHPQLVNQAVGTFLAERAFRTARANQ